jgi:bifunctional NMN adenylyltransferase/nudix hydrolase
MFPVYDAVVFIGRFQAFHNGHKQIITEGLKMAKEVVVVIGSAGAARSARNPFTFAERKQMIRVAFKEADVARVKIVGVADYPYSENKWVAAVQTAVMGAMKFSPDPLKIALIGHAKDHTSYYLKMFPFWAAENVANYQNLSATFIRENMYALGHLGEAIQDVDKCTGVYLNQLAREPWFDVIRDEHKMVKAYKEAWKAAPFPPTFVTVDAVVVQSGHVLLVKRKAMPGAGLWALPGGFLDQQETLLEGAIRELKEETKIKVPVPVLRGSIKRQHTFDAPNRSLRGRTITTAFFIDLGFSAELPKVKGSDDAEVAKWVPFKDINPSQMFEDHFSILDFFTNIG